MQKDFVFYLFNCHLLCDHYKAYPFRKRLFSGSLPENSSLFPGNRGLFSVRPPGNVAYFLEEGTGVRMKGDLGWGLGLQ
jgi:hypothetical protein